MNQLGGYMTQIIEGALTKVKFVKTAPNTNFQKGEEVYLTKDQLEELKDYVEIQDTLSYKLPWTNTK